MSLLQFSVFSGGSVTFDHDRCLSCKSKACIDVCRVLGNGNILRLDEAGLPQLRVTPAQVEKGACVEDMGCLLACQLDGKGAIRFNLPMPKWELALKGMNALPVYRRTLKGK
jgi:NAD-dependent dihydropyrimidine dehydrogenase PreA subunit